MKNVIIVSLKCVNITTLYSRYSIKAAWEDQKKWTKTFIGIDVFLKVTPVYNIFLPVKLSKFLSCFYISLFIGKESKVILWNQGFVCVISITKMEKVYKLQFNCDSTPPSVYYNETGLFPVFLNHNYSFTVMLLWHCIWIHHYSYTVTVPYLQWTTMGQDLPLYDLLTFLQNMKFSLHMKVKCTIKNSNLPLNYCNRNDYF